MVKRFLRTLKVFFGLKWKEFCDWWNYGWESVKSVLASLAAVHLIAVLMLVAVFVFGWLTHFIAPLFEIIKETTEDFPDISTVKGYIKGMMMVGFLNGLVLVTCSCFGFVAAHFAKAVFYRFLKWLVRLCKDNWEKATKIAEEER